MADEVDRRTAITDGAIIVISERGVRALTHRAIDQQLTLPAGSTSYYFRTRQALLAGVVARLAERTMADLAVARAVGEAMVTEGRGRDGRDVDVTEELDLWSRRAGILLDRMIGDRRADSLARYALTLELAADPLLHRSLTAGQPIRAFAQAEMIRFGAADPAAAAADLVSFADGLVFDRLAGTGSLSGPPPGSNASVEQLSRAIRTFLRGVFQA